MFGRRKAELETLKAETARLQERLAEQKAKVAQLSEQLSQSQVLTSVPTDALPADFDPAIYLAFNPDVAAAGVDPREHYVADGANQGRVYSASYAQDGLITIHNSDFRRDPDFQRAYARGLVASDGMEYNWHWRVHVGLWAARMAAHLPGDFIECGVNKGFLSSAIMEDLDWNARDKVFWLLDTFAGIDTSGISSEDTDPGAEDRNAEHFKSGLYTDNVEAVRRNFSQWRNVEIIEGSVPATLSRVASDRIAFASIDMNSAPPEVAAMEWVWPRLVPGALVVFDDYAYYGCPTQYAALKDFARRCGTPILSLPTGQGLMIRPPDA